MHVFGWLYVSLSIFNNRSHLAARSATTPLVCSVAAKVLQNAKPAEVPADAKGKEDTTTDLSYHAKAANV